MIFNAVTLGSSAFRESFWTRNFSPLPYDRFGFSCCMLVSVEETDASPLNASYHYHALRVVCFVLPYFIAHNTHNKYTVFWSGFTFSSRPATTPL